MISAANIYRGCDVEGKMTAITKFRIGFVVAITILLMTMHQNFHGMSS